MSHPCCVCGSPLGWMHDDGRTVCFACLESEAVVVAGVKRRPPASPGTDKERDE